MPKNYTLVDDKGNAVNLIIVDDEASYPLPEGWSLKDPSVWEAATAQEASN